MKKKLKKYQFAGENFCGDGTTWDDTLKKCVPNTPIKPSGIDPQLFPIINNRSGATNTGLHGASTDINGKVIPGNIIPIQRNTDSTVDKQFVRPNAGSYDKRGTFIPYEKVIPDALDKGFNLDSDGKYRKTEITTDPNRLEYSGGFKALNTALDLTRFIAGNINDQKVKREEKYKLNKARYPQGQENIYEDGLNNIPTYFKKGGEAKPKQTDKQLAAAILQHGSIMGRKLTAKQKKHFSAVANGQILMHQHVKDAKKKGTYQKGGKDKTSAISQPYSIYSGIIDENGRDIEHPTYQQAILNMIQYMKHNTPDSNIYRDKFSHHSINTNNDVVPIAQTGGYVNNTGYLAGTETSSNPYNIIPSNTLTMNGVPHNVMAYPNNGKPKLMKAGGGKYTFPDADYVVEVPVKQKGGRLPIITNDKNDPRLKAYSDSLNLYNLSNIEAKAYNDEALNTYKVRNDGKPTTQKEYSNNVLPLLKASLNASEKLRSYRNKNGYKIQPSEKTKINYYDVLDNKMENYDWQTFKKPVQPIVYKKEIKDYPLVDPSIYEGKAKGKITTSLPVDIPDPEGEPVYGPNNGLIGYQNYVQGQGVMFQPTLKRDHLAKSNQLDIDLLNNEEKLKMYVSNQGMKYQTGGKAQNSYNLGEELDLSEEEIEQLKKQGYELQYL